jgi:hypothetical protein
MDLTNRTLIIGGALIWIFLVLVVILLTWGAPDESIDRLGDLAGYLEDHNNGATKAIITLGGLILITLAALVIVIEIAPPETGSVRVQRVGAGEATIGTDEIVQRLEEELRRSPQLRGVQAAVIARGRKAEVQLDLYVAADADLTATSEEACRIARELVEQRMGVELDCSPKARIHYRELQVGRTAAAPATSAQPAASQPTFTTPGAPTFRSPGQPSTSESTTHEAAERTQQDRPAGS